MGGIVLILALALQRRRDIVGVDVVAWLDRQGRHADREAELAHRLGHRHRFHREFVACGMSPRRVTSAPSTTSCSPAARARSAVATWSRGSMRGAGLVMVSLHSVRTGSGVPVR